MRKGLKIFFIILAVLVVGVGVYFAFFGVDRTLSVYRTINECLLYKSRLGLSGDLLELDNTGCANDTIALDEESYPEIYTLRQKLFADDYKLQGGTADSGYIDYYGYTMYERILTEGIRYYSNYAIRAENASKRHANMVCSSINFYKSAISQIYEKSAEVKKIQSSFMAENSETKEEDLVKAYEELRLIYRDYLRKSANLLVDLRDYIVKESFDNGYKFETSSVLYDSLAETITIAMSAKLEQEISYLHDASIYVDKYDEYVRTGSMFYGFGDEIIYLNAYSQLYYDSRNDYDKIFKFTHYQKYDLIHGNNNVSAQISVESLDNAIMVVSLLGL